MKRYRYAVGCSDKVGTDPTVVGGEDGRRRGEWDEGEKAPPREEAPLTDSAWAWRMSRLTRDGATEPVSRNQILRRERGQGRKHFLPY